MCYALDTQSTIIPFTIMCDVLSNHNLCGRLRTGNTLHCTCSIKNDSLWKMYEVSSPRSFFKFLANVTNLVL